MLTIRYNTGGIAAKSHDDTQYFKVNLRRAKNLPGRLLIISQNEESVSKIIFLDLERIVLHEDCN